MMETDTPMRPDMPPRLHWQTKDVASCFPPSARLPRLMTRAAEPSAGPGPHKALARTLLDLGRAEDAWTALAPALAAPDRDTRLLAGTICRQTGRIDAAVAHLREVLAEEPASVPARDGLAKCLDRQKRPEEALAVLADGLRRVPGNADLWASLTAIAVSRRKAAFLERALADLALPDRYIACIDDARIFLAERAGDVAALERWLLAPALVAETDLLAPDDPLLAAVLAEIAQVSDFVSNPYDRTTRGGVQAAFAVTRDRPAWAALFERIGGRVDHYLAALRRDGALFDLPAGEVGVRPWVVRLASGGRQLTHLHPTGWITGVIYLAVPPEVTAADDGAGCLEMPLLPQGLVADWPVRRIRPTAGKLALFPSYMRHATIPFHSERDRICIAFDLLAV